MTNGVIKTRSLGDTAWYWIDKVILCRYGRQIGAYGIAVYNALAFFANSETGTCFPTQKVIAELTGMSKRTVMRKLKSLKELGLIKIEKRRGSCIYRLLKPRGEVTGMTHEGDRGNTPEVTETTPPGDSGDTSEVTEGNTNNNKLTKINNNINVVARQPSPSDGFLINSLIAKFKEVNPNYERLFANKTQRLALERLVKKFGSEKVERIIDILPGIFGRPYAPRITTPLKLEEKLADLLSFLKEEKEKGGRVFTIKPKQ